MNCKGGLGGGSRRKKMIDMIYVNMNEYEYEDVLNLVSLCNCEYILCVLLIYVLVNIVLVNILCVVLNLFCVYL